MRTKENPKDKKNTEKLTGNQKSQVRVEIFKQIDKETDDNSQLIKARSRMRTQN